MIVWDDHTPISRFMEFVRLVITGSKGIDSVLIQDIVRLCSFVVYPNGDDQDPVLGRLGQIIQYKC